MSRDGNTSPTKPRQGVERKILVATHTAGTNITRYKTILNIHAVSKTESTVRTRLTTVPCLGTGDIFSRNNKTSVRLQWVLVENHISMKSTLEVVSNAIQQRRVLMRGRHLLWELMESNIRSCGRKSTRTLLFVGCLFTGQNSNSSQRGGLQTADSVDHYNWLVE